MYSQFNKIPLAYLLKVLYNCEFVFFRLEVFKSLGKVEMVPVPYVTENVRVHVIMPVKSTDIPRILTFLKQYSINAMEKKDLQFLMLVFNDIVKSLYLKEH